MLAPRWQGQGKYKASLLDYSRVLTVAFQYPEYVFDLENDLFKSIYISRSEHLAPSSSLW